MEGKREGEWQEEASGGKRGLEEDGRGRRRGSEEGEGEK